MLSISWVLRNWFVSTSYVIRSKKCSYLSWSTLTYLLTWTVKKNCYWQHSCKKLFKFFKSIFFQSQCNLLSLSVMLYDFITHLLNKYREMHNSLWERLKFIPVFGASDLQMEVLGHQKWDWLSMVFTMWSLNWQHCNLALLLYKPTKTLQSFH